jgi:hypothetical protein
VGASWSKSKSAETEKMTPKTLPSENNVLFCVFVQMPVQVADIAGKNEGAN